jgi:hypothetical protein
MGREDKGYQIRTGLRKRTMYARTDFGTPINHTIRDTVWDIVGDTVSIPHLFIVYWYSFIIKLLLY